MYNQKKKEMDKNLIYGFFILLLLAILFGALYIFHYRIKALESSKLELQKHILYHQQIIERYNRLFQSANTAESFQDIPVPLNPMQPTPRETETQAPVPPQTAGGTNLNSILPMMSSLMSIMQPNSETTPTEEPEDADEEAKRELENELEKELKELQDSIRGEGEEGRVDDIKPQVNSDISSVISEVKSVASVESKDSSVSAS